MIKQALIERAKKRLGSSFYHFGTKQTIKTNSGFQWACDVSSVWGGLAVCYGGWIVWSATKGWLAEQCSSPSPGRS